LGGEQAAGAEKAGAPAEDEDKMEVRPEERHQGLFQRMKKKLLVTLITGWPCNQVSPAYTGS
jgi:hypothetical protein